METDLIIERQKKINILMQKYEDLTRKLLDCPVDDILMLTEKRKRISEEITVHDTFIKNECTNNDELISAYKNNCEREMLPEEFVEVFDLRQQFNSMAFRVSALDPEIKERIELLKNELVDKIKKNNSGQNAKAAKYASVGMSSGKIFIPENKKRI